jgi:hypothetical protein
MATMSQMTVEDLSKLEEDATKEGK